MFPKFPSKTLHPWAAIPLSPATAVFVKPPCPPFPFVAASAHITPARVRRAGPSEPCPCPTRALRTVAPPRRAIEEALATREQVELPLGQALVTMTLQAGCPEPANCLAYVHRHALGQAKRLIPCSPVPAGRAVVPERLHPVQSRHPPYPIRQCPHPLDQASSPPF